MDEETEAQRGQGLGCLLIEPDLSKLPGKSPECTGLGAGTPALLLGSDACGQLPFLPGARISFYMKGGGASAGEDCKHGFRLQNSITCGAKN